MVIADNWVAITDRPTSHQGRLLPATRKPSTVRDLRACLRPSPTTHTRYAATTSQSRVRMSAGEVRLEGVECGERHDPDDRDADVGGFHQRALTRVASRDSAFDNRSPRSSHASRSVCSLRCDSPMARPVSDGAGPPCVVLICTKCRGLMIRSRSASEYSIGLPRIAADAFDSVVESGAFGISVRAFNSKAAMACADRNDNP